MVKEEKLPFRFPEGVSVNPFLNKGMQWFLTWHQVVRNKVAFLIEWGNVYKWPHGYYVENPKTKEIMIEGDNDRIQKFIDILHTDILAIIERLDRPNYSDDYVSRKVLERTIEAIIDAAKKTMDS